MGTIILRIIRDRKISIMIYAFAGVLFLWMYIAMFPSIAQQQGAFDEYMQSFPEVFREAFNLNDFSFAHVENFLAVEHFSIIWPLMAIFLAASFASSSIAREMETGTIELLLSRPVSRLKLFFSRYLAGVMVLVVFVGVSIFAVIPLAEIHGVEYQLQNYYSVAILGALFAWAVFSLCMLLSAFFSEKSKVSMTIGGLLIFMYVLNLVATLKESLEGLKYVSFFYYFDYNSALVHNELNTESIVVFILFAIVCTIVGAWWFKRRDVAV